MDTDPEVRKQKIVSLVKWGAAFVGLVVMTPLIFIALKGALGLLALAVAGAVGYTMIELAPVFAMKVANWRIKQIVDEAGKNPIETLQNVYIERTDEYNEKTQELEDWDTEIRNFDSQAETFKRDYPEDTLQNKQYDEISQAMHEGLKDARIDHADTEKSLEGLAVAIKKGQAIYKMALATQKVTKFSSDAQAKVFQDIKTQVAFDSIRSNLNRSFARLNTAMAKRQAQPALSEGRPVQVIDVTPVPERERVPVSRTRKEA